MAPPGKVPRRLSKWSAHSPRHPQPRATGALVLSTHTCQGLWSDTLLRLMLPVIPHPLDVTDFTRWHEGPRGKV